MTKKKSRSREATNDEAGDAKVRKDKPDFQMLAHDVEVQIADPTVENVKRTLGYVSGEASSKQVKPGHYIVEANINEDGALFFRFAAEQPEAESEEETA